MKYTCSIDINAPLDSVVALWQDENNFHRWQDGFKSIEHLSGTPHEVGAKSRIIIEGKQRIELLETILKNDLPHEKIGLYEHIHMSNTQSSRFTALDENTTRYISEVEYTKFNGIMIKIMAKLFPGKFKQQSEKWMDNFKRFVESENIKLSL